MNWYEPLVSINNNKRCDRVWVKTLGVVDGFDIEKSEDKTCLIK